VRSGWADDAAEEFTLAVARAAQDEEWKRRTGKTARSREAIASGGAVMSVHTLLGRLRGGTRAGSAVVARVAQWLGVPKPYGSLEPPVITLIVILDDQGDHGLEAQDVGTLLSEVAVAPVRRLWPGRIPPGKLTILDGDPGLGKSLITLDLIARHHRARHAR
jgi:hypothetical protein